MSEPQTGVPDGWEVVTVPTTPATSKGHDFKILGVNIHVPAEEKPRLDSNILGWGSSGAGIAPEDALMAGQAVRHIASAASGGGVVAGAKAALMNATPMVKYEATKFLLEKFGVPSSMATVAAAAFAGYKRGSAVPEVPARAPTAPVEAAPVAPAPYEQAIAEAKQAVAARATAAPVASPIVAEPPAAAPAPPAPAAASTPAIASPPSSVASPPAARPAAPASPGQAGAPGSALTVDEFREVRRLTDQGKTLKEALDLVQAQREFRMRFGLTTPTGPETRFPKGFRGGPPK